MLLVRYFAGARAAAGVAEEKAEAATLGALFIIQAGGEQLGIGPQIALAVLMVLTSKGAAGVTGAGLVTLAASLEAFGGQFFTAEAIAVGIALVVGIDRVMSEGRALTNAAGCDALGLVLYFVESRPVIVMTCAAASAGAETASAGAWTNG